MQLGGSRNFAEYLDARMVAEHITRKLQKYRRVMIYHCKPWNKFVWNIHLVIMIRQY